MMNTITKIFFVIFALFFCKSNLVAQLNTSSDKGNINMHFGTIAVYNTFSIGYELPDILKKSQKHTIRALIRLGIWNANLVHYNNGTQGAVGFSYIFGSKKHHFEHSSEFVMHFDKGLKGQPIVYIGSLYRPFIGYRFEAENSPLIFRIGIGWKEALQIGFGYKF